MTAHDRAPLPQRDVPAHRRVAMRAMLVGQVRSRGSARPRRRLVVVATALAVLVLGAVQLWPRQANQAFASWTLAPQPVDEISLADVERECIADLRALPPMPDGTRSGLAGSWRALLVDKRGTAAVALAQAPPDQVGHCMFLGLGEGPFAQVGGGGNGTYAPRGDRTVTVERVAGSAADEGASGSIYGQVGPKVTRVVVTLEDGTRVQASVRHGWYLAWWPNPVRRFLLWWSVRQRQPEIVQAYDFSGRLLAQTRPA